jgi:hypothetical protein
MKFDARVVFAGLALLLGSCQGMNGLDSGMGGMEPPVSNTGSINNGGIGGGMNNGIGGNNQIAGPNVGANGQETLANPGATLAPNEAQYAISQAPNGMKCPTVQQFMQQFTCTLAFNMPTPNPNASPGASPTASPTPTPQPSASSDDDSDTSDDSTPSPPPGGMITLQMEPLPRDLPAMNNPNPVYSHITPLVALRLQSNSNFTLTGGTSVQYTLPGMQYTGRVFILQLYNETSLRGKRIDTYIPNTTYTKYTSPQTNVVQFVFNVPIKIPVRSSQVWLLAMYGAQIPPGTTPTPSPTPSPTASPTGSPKPSST